MRNGHFCWRFGVSCVARLLLDRVADALLEPRRAVFRQRQERNRRADGAGLVENFDLHQRRHQFFRRRVENRGRRAVQIFDRVVLAQIYSHRIVRAVAGALPNLRRKLGLAALEDRVEDDGVQHEVAIFDACHGHFQRVLAHDFEVFRIGRANVLHRRARFRLRVSLENFRAIENAARLAESVGGEFVNVEARGRVLAKNRRGHEHVADLARLAFGWTSSAAGNFAVGANPDLLRRAHNDDARLRRGGSREDQDCGIREEESEKIWKPRRAFREIFHARIMPQNRAEKCADRILRSGSG